MALHDCLCNIHHFWVVFHHFIYDENIYVINLCHLPSPHSFIYSENIYVINPWKCLTIRSKYHLYDLFPRQNKYGYLKILFLVTYLYPIISISTILYTSHSFSYLFLSLDNLMTMGMKLLVFEYTSIFIINIWQKMWF